MLRRRPTTALRAATLLVLLAAVLGAWALTAGPAGGADRAEQLRESIQDKRDREQRLSGAVAKLTRLERATASAQQAIVCARRMVAPAWERRAQQTLAGADRVQRAA